MKNGVWAHERTEVHKTEVTQICRYFLKYDERFRRIRPDKRGCELCRRKFDDDECFNLAFTSKGNKIICQSCTDIAIAHGVKVIDRKREEDGA